VSSMGLELRQLRYFVAVAEAGQITSASWRLNISQPALTLAIKGLERELGVALFERVPSGVRLTESSRSGRRGCSVCGWTSTR
jgi:DNA-binding transcriptional LysR family regulator